MPQYYMFLIFIFSLLSRQNRSPSEKKRRQVLPVSVSHVEPEQSEPRPQCTRIPHSHFPNIYKVPNLSIFLLNKLYSTIINYIQSGHDMVRSHAWPIQMRVQSSKGVLSEIISPTRTSS